MEKFFNTSIEYLTADAIKLLWNRYDGFGEIVIYQNDKKELIIETEYMGKQFVKDVLNDIVDNATIID